MARAQQWWILIVMATAILGAVAAVHFIRALVHDRTLAQRAAVMTGGDPAAGRAALRRLGCATCHTIPGVRGADGRVGPPLDHMANRSFIAGVMANTPANLIVWIRWPQGVLPRSGMPNVGASEADSRNIAAYLYTLE